MSTPVVGLVILGCAAVGGVRLAVLGVRAARRAIHGTARIASGFACGVVRAVGAVKARLTWRRRAAGKPDPISSTLPGNVADATTLALAIALAALAIVAGRCAPASQEAPTPARPRAPRPVIDVLALPAGRRGRGKRASA